MRGLPLLVATLLAATWLPISTAHADPLVTGRFRMRVSEDAARLAKVAGKPSPSGRLVLLAEGKFDLEADGVTRHGSYRNDDGKLVLKTEDGTELRAETKGSSVVVEGLAFDREEAYDLKGQWTVRRNGREDKGMKMDLKSDGTFRFAMVGATSEGKWSVEGDRLILVWSKIDGEEVEAGTVRKEIPVGVGGVFFQIDTYRYERAGL